MSELPQLDRLNVFNPFESASDHHEDRMTRAAMIVLRLVPQALEAFVGIARKTLHDGGQLPRHGLDGPIRLGQPTLGTQKARLVDQPDASGDGEERVPVLLSVFLTPDAHVAFDDPDVREREGGQRLDGVVRFADLVIAIESKVEEGAPSGQSEYISLGELQAEERPVVHIAWQELFAQLLVLAESGLLDLAERALVNDLFEFAEHQRRFDKLLPFQRLSSCRRGDGTLSDYRVKRRLRTVLEKATGRSADQPYPHGWNILVPDGRSLSQAGLYHHNDRLVLAIWPGQKASESRALLEDRDRLARLAARPREVSDPEWYTELLPQVGYYRKHRDLSPDAGLDLAVYAENAQELSGYVGQLDRHAFEAELRPRLQELGLASEDDKEHFAWAQRAEKAKPIFRAGCCVARIWPWERAVALDDDGGLPDAVRPALNELLEALAEEARF